MTPETKQDANTDEIDFAALFAILWRRRWLIILGTLLATVLAAGVSFLLPRTYSSEGFYQLGSPGNREESESEKPGDREGIGLSIPVYKKSAPQFANPDRFLRFAGEWQAFGETDMEKIRSRFRTAADINKWMKPVFAYAKEDTREFSQLSKDESNSVLGLRLNYEADSPQKAYRQVHFFGQYVRDCLMYVMLYDYVKDKYSKIIAGLGRNENAIFDLQFQLQQNIEKMADIKAILTKYPRAAAMENRQVVSVQEGGFRFLGPVTQLVGIESVLADQRRTLADLQRDREKLALHREYFSRGNEALNKANKNGEELFRLLKSAKTDVFKKKDFRIDTVKEVFNDLKIDMQAFDLAFYTNCRFISGPTYPVRHIKPRKSIIVAIAGLLSLFFFVCLAFALSWWQNNRQAILASSKK